MINMIKKQYKYSDITSRIIGCAMKVHSTLGNGFQEVIYQRCLAIEMEEQTMRVSSPLKSPLVARILRRKNCRLFERDEVP